jgi:crotonobetainyl-CoA:carnitine CoA-transferase CaiB-like acyl-CoA transferase
MDGPGLAELRMAGFPIKFSDGGGAASLPPPQLGEHSRAILREMGFADAAIGALLQRRVIGETFGTGP